MFRESTTIRRRMGNPELSESLNNLAVALSEGGKPAEAEKVVEEALQIARRVHGTNSEDAAYALNTLGAIRYYQGKYAQAELTFRQAIEVGAVALSKRNS